MQDLQDDAQAMAGSWGLDAPEAPSALATNNRVWRCGNVWLKAFLGDLPRRRREIALLCRLAEGFGRVPRLLPTKDGCLAIEHKGALWTAEAGLEGTHPDADSIDDYARIGHGIVDLHAAMSKIELDGSGVGCLADLRHSLLHPVPCATDLPVVARSTAALLRDVLGWIETWPGIVIHGDLTHPNILIASDGSCGFLDFEFVSKDPFPFDVAAVATTLLVRSTLDGTARRDAWKNLLAVSERFRKDQIIVAALARRWIAFTANLRHPSSSADIYRRQIRHLEVMMPMARLAFGSYGRIVD